METKTNLVIKKIKYICDECGTGEMEFTGEVDARLNPSRKHKCGSCQYEVYYNDQYPYVVYEDA